MAISMLAGAAGGLITAAGSLVGGRARKKREAASKAEYDMQLQNLKDFNFENYYAGMENVYEDMTVNQDAARFQSELRDARLAQQQQSLLQAGLGGAATAQALLGATVSASRQDAADIAKQEQAIQGATLQEQSRLNMAQATGAQDVESQKYLQQQQFVNIAGTELQAARDARAASTKQLFGGLGMAFGGAMGADGGFV
jgi:hypothetical protein